MGLGGLPPRLPLARAASALASDVTFPPLRPRATAAGFLRGTRGIQISQGDTAKGTRMGVGGSFSHLTDFGRFGRVQGQANRADGGLGEQDHGGGVRHEAIKPNRLGSVKWA